MRPALRSRYTDSTRFVVSVVSESFIAEFESHLRSYVEKPRLKFVALRESTGDIKVRD